MTTKLIYIGPGIYVKAEEVLSVAVIMSRKEGIKPLPNNKQPCVVISMRGSFGTQNRFKRWFDDGDQAIEFAQEMMHEINDEIIRVESVMKDIKG